MTLKEILDVYINFCWQAFQYDMDVFSRGWMYYWLFIPAFCYLVFFFVKWSVITAPLWLPIKMILTGFNININNSNNNKDKK